MRDHPPIIIDEFNGLWKRGNEDACPIDHFPEADNVKYFESGVETRDGIDTFIARGNVLRIHDHVMQTGQSLLILDTSGNIYHALLDSGNTVYGPILSIPEMTDFNCYSWAGRAYITPFKSFTDNNGHRYQKGLEDEFLYVYKGDGSQARAAGGDSPTNGGDSPLVGYNSSIIGVVDRGIHIIGVTGSNGVNESGGLGPEGLAIIYAPGDFQVNLNNIPIGGAGITERKIYMTQAIDPEDWNPDGDIRDNYTFYFVKTIADNTTVTTILNVADANLTSAFVPGALDTLTNSPMFIENTNVDGYCDLGLHVVGVVYETDTGFFTAPGPEFFAVQTYVNEQKAIKVSGIPVSPDTFVTRRHLVSSIKLAEFNGNNRQEEFAFQLFFIPNGTINDNITTELTLSYYDSELIEDASYLVDNFAQIPAGVGLASYNGRMALWASFDDISVVRFSAPNEPEVFDQVDGFVIVPLDGNALTNGREYRDIFYAFKLGGRTYAITDNGGLPSTWPEPIAIDMGIGASVHGIAEVLDSGGVDIEYLIICDWSGVYVFNGTFLKPEISWKIEDLWLAYDRDYFDKIQVLNDTLNKIIYMTLPDNTMLHANYQNGLNAKKIKWGTWSYDIKTTTIALIDTDTVVIGSEGLR